MILYVLLQNLLLAHFTIRNQGGKQGSNEEICAMQKFVGVPSKDHKERPLYRLGMKF